MSEELKMTEQERSDTKERIRRRERAERVALTVKKTLQMFADLGLSLGEAEDVCTRVKEIGERLAIWGVGILV
jgi:hypothetical protein